MLTVVRHGRTTANRDGLLLGRLDVDLDDVGRAQAEALAGLLGVVDLVVTSPLRRTRDTAAPLVAATGAELVVDDRFVELDYGDWDGRPLAEVDPESWRRWRSDLSFRPPRGESLEDLGRRVRAGCEALAARARTDHVVVVTHVSPIKAAAAWALGVGDEVTWRMFVAPGSVTRISVSDRGVALHGFNDTAHLLLPPPNRSGQPDPRHDAGSVYRNE